MTTLNVINSMLRDLSKHQETSKEELLTSYVQLRLNRSLETYYKEILTSYNVLTHQNETKVLKQLTKKQN